MKCSDIPVQEVLQACADYNAEVEARRSQIAAQRFGGILSVSDAVEIVEAMRSEPPLMALQNRYPFKVVLRKLEKLYERNLLEYGTSITYARLTPKGEEVLKSIKGRAGQ